MTMTDWASLGLGVIELARSMGTGSNGVAVESDAASYHVGTYPAQGQESTWPVLIADVHYLPGLNAEGDMVRPLVGRATISLTGTFAVGGALPPVIANARMWCSEQVGDWGTSDREHELVFKADGLPTPIAGAGGVADPHVQFQCRLELKIATFHNVVLHFVLDLNSMGATQFSTPHFEYGHCDVVNMGSHLHVKYFAETQPD